MGNLRSSRGSHGHAGLDPRVDINHYDKHNITPFALAAQEGNKEIIALLLKLPHIDTDQTSKDGRTPLSRAAHFGHSGVIKQLKRHGRLRSDHSHKDNTNRNAFSWAAEAGRDDTIKHLLKYGFPGIDEENHNQWTPLFRH